MLLTEKEGTSTGRQSGSSIEKLNHFDITDILNSADLTGSHKIKCSQFTDHAVDRVVQPRSRIQLLFPVRGDT